VIASSYIFYGLWIYALALVAVGVFWSFSKREENASIDNFGLLSFTIASAVGVLFGFSNLWMFTSVILGLIAWDIAFVVQRIAEADKIFDGFQFVELHLKRLLPVVVLSFVFGVIAFSISLDLGFWWLVLLALIGIIGMNRVISSLRQGSD
jgi:hypothetical protein